MLDVADTDWTNFTNELSIKSISKFCSMSNEKEILNVDIRYVLRKVFILFRPIWCNYLFLLRKGKQTETGKKGNIKGKKVSSWDHRGLKPRSRVWRLQRGLDPVLLHTKLVRGRQASVHSEVLQQASKDQFFSHDKK